MQQPERCHPGSANYADTHAVKICVYAREPFTECHCISISSANIPKIISVCGDKFRSCPIYRREIEKKVLPATFSHEGDIP